MNAGFHRICNSDEFIHDLLLEAISYGAYLLTNLETKTTIIAREIPPGFEKVHGGVLGIPGGAA